MAQTLNTIRNYPGMEEGMTTTALNGAVAVIRENLPVFTEKFQSSNSFGGFYEPTENVEWTTGFWTGRSGWPMSIPGMRHLKRPPTFRWKAF